MMQINSGMIGFSGSFHTDIMGMHRERATLKRNALAIFALVTPCWYLYV